MQGLIRVAPLGVLVLVVIGCQAGEASGAPPAAPVNFQRQVRPILSDNCFLCHGPDKGTRMVNLRSGHS